jgi:transposase
MSGMLNSGVVVLHDISRPHTAARTRALLKHFNWELFDYPPHSPDLAPSDYHLFTYLKDWLRSQRFNNSKELMDGVKTWLSSQAADFFDTDIKKIIPLYDKCLSSCCGYVEKYLKRVRHFCI